MPVTFGPSKSHPSYFTYLINTPLGDPVFGGYLICRSGGTVWIVAPASTEVTRTWHCRNDAVTTAESNAACGDWFVPTCGQLKNPGYTCRTYWDSCSSGLYWSSTHNLYCAWGVNFDTGTTYITNNLQWSCCVRAFRCVTY